MDIKLKVGMAVATVAIALGTGHAMQTTFGQEQDRAALAEKPVAVTPLAAGLGPDTGPTATPSPDTRLAALPDTPVAPPAAAEPALILPETSMAPRPDVIPPTALPEASAPTTPIRPLEAEAAPDCPVTLTLTRAGRAMLDVALAAPCHAGERVVLRHGGLAITARVSDAGRVLMTLPGMEAEGRVSIRFPDGTEALAEADLPDLPIYQRYAIQWMDRDTFQLNAFEGGALWGEEGHVSATNPQRLVPGVPPRGGYMTLLGDDTVDLPMLAEVYTYPLNPNLAVDMTVEVVMTPETCNRDLLGELVLSIAGDSIATDLTLATPGCDAIGDVLVLNNPHQDLKLALVE